MARKRREHVIEEGMKQGQARGCTGGGRPLHSGPFLLYHVTFGLFANQTVRTSALAVSSVRDDIISFVTVGVALHLQWQQR